MDFTHCIPSSSPQELNHDFYERLYKAEVFSGVKFNINSAFRSRDWEINQGRDGSSSHCLGLAVDIYCPTGTLRLAILKALLSNGFSRIGIGRNFIHVDCDSSKPSSIWLYGTK